MLSLGLGITSPQFRPFSPSQLFQQGEQGVVLDPSSIGTLFQDAQGQLPVTGSGDPVGLVLDKSGNDNHLTAPSGAARPVYAVSESGDKLLQSDEVDDELSVTLPDLGADVTIAYTTQSELRIDEGETVGAGEYTLPQVDLLNYLMIDRQLTKSEKIELIRYLSRSAEGVNYGAVIDDMILACMNAVDVFVYDTTKDSDGGAWRTGSLAKASSWYNETLNTTTRGSRREFPAVAVIVAENTKVTIYDGDDPSLPMWMVFTRVTGNLLHAGNVSSVSARNGVISAGTDASLTDQGLRCANFASDALFAYKSGAGNYRGGANGGVAARNDVLTWADDLPYIVSNAVNDVAMTVLPDAPIDPATGLPVPTIAVATDGGVSVIKDDGTVVDIVITGTVYDGAGKIAFNHDNTLVATVQQSGSDQDYWNTITFDVPEADKAAAYWHSHTDIFTASYGNYSASDLSYFNTDWNFVSTFAVSKNNTIGGNLGVGLMARNPSNLPTSMVALLTSTYNTGWMPGSIKGAFLSDTDDTDLVGSGELVTNGTFDSDVSGWAVLDDSTIAQVGGAMRLTNGANGYATASQAITCNIGQRYKIIYSVSAPATTLPTRVIIDVDELQTSPFIASPAVVVTGTQTFEFVATATTHYLQMQVFSGTASVAMDFDNISVKLADADRSVNNNGLVVTGNITRSPVATGADLVAYSGFSASNYLEQPYNSDLDFGTGDFCVMGWVKFNGSSAETILRRQDVAESGARFGVDISPTQKIRFFSGVTLVDGTTSIDTNTWVFFAAVRRSGVSSVYVNGASEASSASTDNVTNTSAILKVGLRAGGAVPLTNGSLALLRISATAPTAEQIAKIYNDEKVLFQENAAATLYGTSDAVTALAHDPDTDLLHVGTSYGRSVFRGLERIQSTTTSVSKAISASGGLVAEK